MWREIIYSMIGHALVFGGLFFPPFLKGEPQTHLRVYTIRTVTPQSIEQLLKKSALTGKPRPKIPQVMVEPDRKLPSKTRRPKQIAKLTSTQSEKTSTGDKTGKQSKKSPVAGIKLDSEFDYPDYLIEMRDRIKNNWQPPTLKTALVTRVYFKLGRDGRIIRAFVEKPTENISFDMTAMNAITKSAPFTPLPEGFSGKELGVHFDFIYEQ